jgi:hypothetical protein
LFIRYQLTVTPALPESDQPSARAQGTERFESFVDSHGRRLQQGKTLVQELPFDLTAPRDPDGTDDMRASVTEEVDDDPS